MNEDARQTLHVWSEREAVHGRNWGVWEGVVLAALRMTFFSYSLETVQTCIHSLRHRSATAGRWPAFGGIQGAYVTVNLSCLTWILLRGLDPINKNHSLFMQVGFFSIFFIWICVDVGSPSGHNHMTHPFSPSPYIPKPPSSQALVDPFSLFSPLLFSSSLDSGRIAHFVNLFPRNHVAQLDFQWLRSFTEVPRHLGECCFSTSWMEPRQPWSRARKETLLVAAPRSLMLPFKVCSWWCSFQTGESNAFMERTLPRGQVWRGSSYFHAFTSVGLSLNLFFDSEKGLLISYWMSIF